MSDSARKLRLGAFLMGAGHHVAAWRHPDAQADGAVNFAHYKRLAATAERAKFDMIFVADSDGVWNGLQDREVARRSRNGASFEPLTLFSALAAVTSRIGFVATASTTYNEPYHIARKFASLDLISGGRAGWNVVTSGNESAAFNFGHDRHPDHATRYRRATEFLDVVTGLWGSWADDAFLRDKASGVYFDPDKLQILNHRGEFFKVQGPLNVSRSPQGQPVIVQAGSSDPGQDLAARTAEVIFTAQPTLAAAQAFYASVKGRLAGYGRRPDELKIMPGIFPIVARTQAEADEKYERLQALLDPKVGLALLSGAAGGVDLSAYPLDGPVPADLPETNGGRSRQRLLLDLAARENLTIRQLYLRIAGARGHWTVVGTPASIVDQMEEWFVKAGADGFNVMPPHLPGGLDDFVELIIPELRRRGLFRSEYEGTTLRENLGLAPAARVTLPKLVATA